MLFFPVLLGLLCLDQAVGFYVFIFKSVYFFLERWLYFYIQTRVGKTTLDAVHVLSTNGGVSLPLPRGACRSSGDLTLVPEARATLITSAKPPAAERFSGFMV